MVDKKIFDELRKQIKLNDDERERYIVDSRPIIKHSKQAIYALHRNNFADADELIKKAINALKKLDTSEVGPYKAALQELCEAVTYQYYIKNKKLISPEKIGFEIDANNYLLGICDLTGELARRAVMNTINEEYDEIKFIKEFVSDIYNEFLKFEFRNGELRKKSDSIKWNLKKIEEIIYDIKIRDKI